MASAAITHCAREQSSASDCRFEQSRRAVLRRHRSRFERQHADEVARRHRCRARILQTANPEDEVFLLTVAPARIACRFHGRLRHAAKQGRCGPCRWRHRFGRYRVYGPKPLTLWAKRQGALLVVSMAWITTAVTPSRNCCGLSKSPTCRFTRSA